MSKTAKNADVVAANEIYQVAQAEANQKLQAMQADMEAVRAESETIGVLKTIAATIAYQELLKALTLYNIKQYKTYKGGGMTWANFCDAIGMPVRTVDLLLEDLRPVVENFSATVCQFSGLPLSKIRYLGRTISANLAEIQNGAICYDGETIPITPENADDIQALIERIDEDARKAKEDAEADIKAKDRVLKAKEDVIRKQEKELARVSKDARKKGLTPEEDAYIKRMAVSRDAIDGFLGDLDAEQGAVPSDATPRMISAYLETVGYLKRIMNLTHENAVGMYGAPDDEAVGWTPPAASAEISAAVVSLESEEFSN